MTDVTPGLPQLPRYVAQPEKEEADKEVWFPSWSCFCCHDSGFVRDLLVLSVIPDYNPLFDRPPVCQACPTGIDRANPDIHDLRFTRKTCVTLDKIERLNWTTSIKAQQQLIVDTKALASKMAMPGTRDRTDNDNREVQQRKQHVEAISHEEWLAASNQYLGKE